MNSQSDCVDAEATALELLSLITDDADSACDDASGPIGTAASVTVASGHDVMRQGRHADGSVLLFPNDTLTSHLGLDGVEDIDLADLIPLSDMDALSCFLDYAADVTHEGSASDEVSMPSSSSTSTLYAVEPVSGAPPSAATTAATVGEDTKPRPVPILPRKNAPVPKETSANSAHRKRAKDELEYLRQQVQVLEQRLADLKQHPSRAYPAATATAVCEEQRLQRIASGDKPIDATESSSSSTALQAQQQLWKRIAKRQLDEKQRAEVENLKLKQMLETQLKIAQSLSRVLRKRPDVSWLDPHHQFGTKKLRIETLDESENVFEMLAERVETLFDQLDDVMRDSGLADQKTELQDGVVKSDELDRVFIEVANCKIVPFDVHTTAAALWKILSSSSSMKVSNGVYQAIDASEDSLRAQFTVTVRLRRSEAQVHVRLVGKRIVESSRVVFVWCSLGESEGSLFGKNRLYLRESAWTVIEEITMPAAPNSLQHRTPSNTISKSVMRMSPEMENNSSESSHQIGVFTDVVLSGHHQNLAMLHQNAENLVMSELCAYSQQVDSSDLRHPSIIIIIISSKSDGREDAMRADDDHSSSNGVWFTLLSPMSEAATPRTAATAPVTSAIRRADAAEEQLSSPLPLSLAAARGDVDASDTTAECTGSNRNDSGQAHFFHFGEPFEFSDLGFLDAIGMDTDETSSAAIQEVLGGGVQDAAQVTPTTISALADPGSDGTVHTPRSGIDSTRSDKKTPKQQQQRKEVKLKRIRKCVKRELEYLQVQVEALEQQLEVLQSVRNGPGNMNSEAFGSRTSGPVGSSFETRTLTTKSPSATAARAIPPPPPGLWERIARSQLDEKKKSEEENARLRTTLEGQIKVANSLARVLKKRPDVSWLTGSETKRPRIHDDTTALSTNEILAQIVDSLYARLDTVFANTSGLQEPTQLLDARDVQVQSDANGRIQMEFFTSKAFPFDVSTTVAVAWKLAGRSLGKVSNGYYQALEFTDSVVRSQASGTLCILQQDVGLHCDILIKKVVQDDRVVILWCVLGGSDVSKTTVAAPKFTIRETGWAIIKEVLYDSKLPDTSPTSSVIQSVVHVTPEFSQSVASGDSEGDDGDVQPGLLTDVIMSAYLQNMSAVHQNMENLLMVEALNRKEASV